MTGQRAVTRAHPIFVPDGLVQVSRALYRLVRPPRRTARDPSDGRRRQGRSETLTSPPPTRRVPTSGCLTRFTWSDREVIGMLDKPVPRDRRAAFVGSPRPSSAGSAPLSVHTASGPHRRFGRPAPLDTSCRRESTTWRPPPSRLDSDPRRAESGQAQTMREAHRPERCRPSPDSGSQGQRVAVWGYSVPTMMTKAKTPCEMAKAPATGTSQDGRIFHAKPAKRGRTAKE